MDTVRRATVAAAGTCFTVACFIVGAPQLATWVTPRPDAASVRVSAPAVIEQPDFDLSRRLRGASVQDQEPAVDLYGNEVSTAVATYKLDAAGVLYEEHSPNTAMPRLGGPKT